MSRVSFDLPEQQWQRIIAEARQTWSNERLSDAELLRRCVILGVRCLAYLSPESARQFVAIYRNYQPPFDSAVDLPLPDEPEDDHPSPEVFRS
jgi:hypothetical protein